MANPIPFTGEVVVHVDDRPEALNASDLAGIKISLDEALAKGVVPEFAQLRTELEHAGIFADGSGRAHIGTWTLSDSEGDLRLVRQQFPRAPIMVFYIASLARVDGRWAVTQVTPQRVRGAR